eukprot:COSAG01_NODE_20463_length_952_cov_1.100821_1_plen_220_part_00
MTALLGCLCAPRHRHTSASAGAAVAACAAAAARTATAAITGHGLEIKIWPADTVAQIAHSVPRRRRAWRGAGGGVMEGGGGRREGGWQRSDRGLPRRRDKLRRRQRTSAPAPPSSPWCDRFLGSCWRLCAPENKSGGLCRSNGRYRQSSEPGWQQQNRTPHCFDNCSLRTSHSHTGLLRTPHSAGSFGLTFRPRPSHRFCHHAEAKGERCCVLVLLLCC